MRAKKMIEDGVINAAIIGSCNLCMNPSVSLQLEGLGKLTQTTETRSFSEDGMYTNINNEFRRYNKCKIAITPLTFDIFRSLVLRR